MADETLSEMMNRIRSMTRLTNVELIRTYWQHANKIAETNRLAFIIQGNIQWNSKRLEGIVGNNGLWLKSNRHEPFGKHVSEEPVRTYLQWYMNLYEIWGTLDIDIDPNNASTSKPLIEHAVNKISCINNALSLLYGASLRWYPASYAYIRHVPLPPLPEREVTYSWDCIPHQRAQEEGISIDIQDEHITEHLFPLVARIESLPKLVRPVISRAIDWHAQANYYTSDLVRFVNYWASIELLGNYFYKHLPAKKVQRNPRSVKRLKIMEQLSGITVDNCMHKISKCNDILTPSARIRILAFLNTITDKNVFEIKLFEPDTKTEKSLYQIRNEIAHGNISESDIEESSSLRQRLFDARKMSRNIILLTINNATKLNFEIVTSS